MAVLSIQRDFDFEDGRGPVPAHQHPNGGGWVADSATVEDTVFVGRNALIYGDARLYDTAQVGGNARVFGNARISDHAAVYGDAQVYGDAEVYGRAQVCGNAKIHGVAKVCGRITVSDDSHLSDRRVLLEQPASPAPLNPIDYELLDELRSQVERVNEQLASESEQVVSMFYVKSLLPAL